MIDLVDAARTRRSNGRLLDQSPSDAELARLLKIAMSVLPVPSAMLS